MKRMKKRIRAVYRKREDRLSFMNVEGQRMQSGEYSEVEVT